MTIDWPGLTEAIKSRRARLGLTQAELAARVGVRLPTIGRIEIGNRRPSIDLLERIADALGCRVRDLLPEKSKKPTALPRPRTRRKT